MELQIKPPSVQSTGPQVFMVVNPSEAVTTLIEQLLLDPLSVVFLNPISSQVEGSSEFTFVKQGSAYLFSVQPGTPSS